MCPRRHSSFPELNSPQSAALFSQYTYGLGGHDLTVTSYWPRFYHTRFACTMSPLLTATLCILKTTLLCIQGRNQVFKVGGRISWSRVLLPFYRKKFDRSTQFGAVGYIITLDSSKSYVKSWGRYVQILGRSWPPSPLVAPMYVCIVKQYSSSTVIVDSTAVFVFTFFALVTTTCANNKTISRVRRNTAPAAQIWTLTLNPNPIPRLNSSRTRKLWRRCA